MCQKSLPFYFLNNCRKLADFNGFFVLDPDNIWHQWLVLHLPTSSVYFSQFAFGNLKSHFSAVLFSLRYTTHQVEHFFQKCFFSSSGFPEWRAYTIRTFNLPLSKTMFSINTLSLCLSTFTTLYTRFSATNIPTPSDYPYLPLTKPMLNVKLSNLIHTIWKHTTLLSL